MFAGGNGIQRRYSRHSDSCCCRSDYRVTWWNNFSPVSYKVIPSLSLPAKGDANSTTKSAVAPRTIDVRDNPTQDISALSRDTANSLNELGRIFDKQKIEEQQELAAFGEEAFRLAHNLPDDGSGRKIAVHAIIGGIMSRIAGAGFASGAIGAGVNEAIIGEIKKIKDPGTAQIVSAIVEAAAAKYEGSKDDF